MDTILSALIKNLGTSTRESSDNFEKEIKTNDKKTETYKGMQKKANIKKLKRETGIRDTIHRLKIILCWTVGIGFLISLSSLLIIGISQFFGANLKEGIGDYSWIVSTFIQVGLGALAGFIMTKLIDDEH